MSASTTQTRPLVIQAGPARVSAIVTSFRCIELKNRPRHNQISIPISADCDDWLAAEVLREEFTHNYKATAVVIDEENTSANKELQVDLIASFAAFVASSLTEDEASVPHRLSLLKGVVAKFTSQYLSGSDIHNVTATYDADLRKHILTSYFSALATLEDRVPAAEVPRPKSSALLKAAATRKAFSLCSIRWTGRQRNLLRQIAEPL